jgi:selenocysteine lyase/cysteine desulfurase
VKLTPAPDTAPDRAETGTQNHEGIAGTRAAIDFLASLADGVGAGSQPARGAAESRTLHTRRERLAMTYAELHDRGISLARKLWEAFASMNHVHLYGPDPSQPRTPTVAFTVDGISAEDVSRTLARDGLFASHGDFYAMTAIEKLGVEALIRIGCACYTTENEIDRLIATIDQIAR